MLLMFFINFNTIKNILKNKKRWQYNWYYTFKKEIEIIDKKINRLNDLYINDLIDLPKLKKDIEELNHLKDDYNKAIKLNYLDKKNEDSLGMLMDNIDIRKSSYDVQSRIVKQLIDRVEVTMDNIDIIFKF